MNSRDYWKDRNIKALAAVEREEEKTKRRLLKIYRAEETRLRKEIAAFYQQHGEKGVVEFRKVLEQLTPAEKNALYSNFRAFTANRPQIAHLEEIRNNIYKLNRLEGLQASVSLHLAQIAEQEEAEVSEHLQKIGHISWEAVSDTLGHGVDERIARRFIGTEWAGGADFSSRVWGNAEKTAAILNTEIAQGFARGDNYRKLTKKLTDKFENVTTRQAYRLIYTEGTYVYNETAAEGFSEEGYKAYQISTAQDAKVCSICRDLDGLTFRFDEREPGTNFPPMHPFCRCSFVVVDVM